MKARLSSILKSPLFWIFVPIIAVLAAFAGMILSSVGGTNRQSEKILSKQVSSGVIDEKTGSYRGLAKGDSAARVRRLLGEPIERGGIFVPQVAWNTVWNGVDTDECRSWRRKSGDFHAMVYREVVFTIVGGRVCAYEVAGSGWSTTGGTKAGQSIDQIRARFGNRACTEFSHHEDPLWKEWNCTGRTKSGIRMQFAGDPVSSVAVD